MANFGVHATLALAVAFRKRLQGADGEIVDRQAALGGTDVDFDQDASDAPLFQFYGDEGWRGDLLLAAGVTRTIDLLDLALSPPQTGTVGFGFVKVWWVANMETDPTRLATCYPAATSGWAGPFSETGSGSTGAPSGVPLFGPSHFLPGLGAASGPSFAPLGFLPGEGSDPGSGTFGSSSSSPGLLNLYPGGLPVLQCRPIGGWPVGPGNSLVTFDPGPHDVKVQVFALGVSLAG